MATERSFEVKQAASYAYRFAATSWQMAMPALLLMVAITTITVMLSRGNVGESVQSLGAPSYLLLIVFSVMVSAMLLRLSIRGEFSGPAGLQIGQDERRLLLANLAYLALLVLLGMIFGFIAIVLITAGLMSAIDNPTALENDPEAMRAELDRVIQDGGWLTVAAVVGLVVIGPMLFIHLRLICFPAACILKERVLIFKTWSWTKGYILKILGSYIIAVGPALVLSLALSEFVLRLFGQTMFPQFQLAGAQNAVEMIDPFSALLVGGAAQIPGTLLSTGLGAFLAKELDPGED